VASDIPFTVYSANQSFRKLPGNGDIWEKKNSPAKSFNERNDPAIIDD